MVLCADDLLAPGALRRAVRIMEGDGRIAFVYGRDIEHRHGAPLPRLADEMGPPWATAPGEAFIEERCREPAGYIAAGAVLARSAAQKQAGHYRPELPYTDDLEMLLRLAVIGHVAKIDAVQGVRRLHGANMSEMFLQTRLSDLLHREAAFESFFAREGASLYSAPRLRALARRSLAARAYRWSLRSLIQGRPRDAADLLGFALRRWPAIGGVPPRHGLFRAPARQSGPTALVSVAAESHLVERHIRRDASGVE
jgi:hypothetical protein